MGARKIMISHAEKDAVIVDQFVELLFHIGIIKEEVIYTANVECGVPLGMDIYGYLREQMNTSDMISFFMLSQNYYESAACLNEMGAVWMRQSQYYTILLPGFHFEEIKGAINPTKKALHLEWPEEKLKGELTILKDQLSEIFSLQMSEPTWEKYRDDFIHSIRHTDSAVKIDLKNSEGICIGDSRHIGMKVEYEEPLQRLLGKVNFNKTNAGICCMVIYTDDLKIKKKIELDKCLKFSMKTSETIETMVVEMMVSRKNGKVDNIHYNVPAHPEWNDYRIRFKDFMPKGSYEYCSQLKFTIFKDNIRGKKGEVSVCNVEFE